LKDFPNLLLYFLPNKYKLYKINILFDCIKSGQKPDQGLGIEVNAKLKIIINPLAQEKPFR